ncbi:helix-turn-helix domain-containing protein [Actinomyces sp. MRS3W]|uniref:helix-turn-helix domain-containing protein n=1 Tax=Actinomyces sp. MRS3W TaxID=2800796 RepID=UPI0028FD8C2B|nr:helix-turn-helix domain-containing protein [Actinomyces sp. MRS3W]MDU0348005.1 helix-turn-helix domain-containing protein [Actinomyces sp. MRS3W]
MKQSVGRNIARLRLAQAMTQEQLAKRMGVTPQAVSKWENDLNYPDVATLPVLARLLNTSVDELLAVPNDADAPSPTTSPTSPLSTPTAASPPTASSPAAASTNFALIRPEPATDDGPQAPRVAGRSLHIEVRGPQNNVDLAFPMQAISALAGFVTSVPQVRTAVADHGIDLDALLATSYSALDGAGPSTLIDVTDEEDRVRIYVD